MQRISGPTLAAAGIFGALGVMIGAFGAHGLEARLTSFDLPADLVQRRLNQFDTGARYHLVHAVALLALASLCRPGHILTRLTTWLFALGIVFFSGSLYLLVLTGETKLGMVTPIGGLMWIVGWITLALSAKSATHWPAGDQQDRDSQ